jgi:signal transduction histidine kinase/CheY-like chemotaxis protein
MGSLWRGQLFRKYLIFFIAVTGLMLLLSSLVSAYFAFQGQQQALIRLQESEAKAAAQRITQFITEIESQLGWATHLPLTGPDVSQQHFDARRLLRQVPAVMEIGLVDADGRERLRASRLQMDTVDSKADFSADPRFRNAIQSRVSYGAVYFRRETEPFMTLSVSGTRRESGVAMAEVNLKHIWDVIRLIRVGHNGTAYVVDIEGRLIAHPDISLVLRRTDLSHLPQVRSARGKGEPERALNVAATDLAGRRVLSASAKASPLEWLVFVELPESEAYAPLYADVARSALVFLLGLTLAAIAAAIVARRMVQPVELLTRGAAEIGAGVLHHRIEIRTGDELEDLGTEFNRMAGQLQSSYATLERKVEERTLELARANQAKARFLAVASHDLRQPLHALTLFISQLRSEVSRDRRERLLARLDAAACNMNEQFDELLDISKLDAGVIQPKLSPTSVSSVLARIETMLAPAAAAKGLLYSTEPCPHWVSSDPVLLERVVQNLVSNAIRYTDAGSVRVTNLVQGDNLCLSVTDTGPGIEPAQQQEIFSEFYRTSGPGTLGSGGLGLGLFIVDRLIRLLRHRVTLESSPGWGSTFTLVIPLAAAPAALPEPPASSLALTDIGTRRRALVIEDDALALDAMVGLLETWGFEVDSVQVLADATSLAKQHGPVWDLIIADFDLKARGTGTEAVVELRALTGKQIPALLVSGDTSPRPVAAAKAVGLTLLRKPVLPMTLRTAVVRLLAHGGPGRETIHTSQGDVPIS